MAAHPNAKRALCESLWAEGVATDEIVRQMGWNQGEANIPPANYIARYRQLGWDLPPRDPQRAAAIKAGRWSSRR